MVLDDAMPKLEEQPMIHLGMASDEVTQRMFYEAGKIYRLQIESTLNCPQLCDYCYANSTPESPQGMTKEKIEEVLDSATKLGIQVIDWLGGDPLVRPDWYELCQRAILNGLVNNIWSSGIPLDNPWAARKAVEVTKGGFISVHLDSIDAGLYSKVHGNPGHRVDVQNINRILNGIENLLKAGKDPRSMVNCITFTRDLANGDAIKTIDFLYKRYHLKTCLTLFKPVQTNPRNRNWQPTDSQIKETYAFRDSLYPNDLPVGAMDVSKFYCGSKICVNAFGWLTPCSVIRIKDFGNVNEEPLEKLIERHRRQLLFLDFRDKAKMPGNCGSCRNNQNCFGCRSNAYYYSGNLFGSDPMCQAYKSVEKHEDH